MSDQIILDSIICNGYRHCGLNKDLGLETGCVLFLVKDTPGMFLLHRRLGGVDGFADAAQLRGEQMTGMNLGRLGMLLHPHHPTYNRHDNSKFTSGEKVKISGESMNRCQAA